MLNGLSDVTEVDWVKQFPLWLMANYSIDSLRGTAVMTTRRIFKLKKVEKQITSVGSIVVFQFLDAKTKSIYSLPFDRLYHEVIHRNFFPCIHYPTRETMIRGPDAAV